MLSVADELFSFSIDDNNSRGDGGGERDAFLKIR